MISQLRLRNFQSHAHTDLALARFTVVVGPSSSGKSSVVRALRVLAQNARGTAYVRSGVDSCVVEAVCPAMEGDPEEASLRVAISRGKVNEYRLAIPDQDEQRFTKIGTKAPEAITAALDFGFDDMWLAGQFDRPFLLDETGTQVARTLGDLSGVSMIFAAVRECSRRSGVLKTRHRDRTERLDVVRGQVMAFRELPAQREAITRAESALAAARVIESKAATLRSVVAETTQAAARSSDAQKLLRSLPAVHTAVALAERRALLRGVLDNLAALPTPAPAVALPDPTDAIAQGERVSSLRRLVRDAKSAAAASEASAEARDRAQDEVQGLQVKFDEALREAGRCPVCGADAVSAA